MLVLPIVVGLLLLLSALLAASETALFALLRMEHTREQLSAATGRALDRLLARPLELLIVVIGLSEAANLFAECLATIFLLNLLGRAGAYVSAPLMAGLVLLFCDITPKALALGFPGPIARLMARPVVLLTEFVHPLARLFVPSLKAPEPEPVSEAEFKALLRVSERLGEVEPQEREFIHRVFDFGARRVYEVMTPRDQIFALDSAMPFERVIDEVAHRHFSRVPLYRGNLDHIIGILHTKDLATGRLRHVAPRLERLARLAYFVPPGKPLAELFDEMRGQRFQLAIVVDEYGRVRGLVTLEDLLEELFGEIRDEFEIEGPELTQVSEHEWVVSGAIDADRLSAILGCTRPIGSDGRGRRTLSAVVLRRLKRVPQVGERFRLDDFEATVERVRGATVERLRLRL